MFLDLRERNRRSAQENRKNHACPSDAKMPRKLTDFAVWMRTVDSPLQLGQDSLPFARPADRARLRQSLGGSAVTFVRRKLRTGNREPANREPRTAEPRTADVIATRPARAHLIRLL